MCGRPFPSCAIEWQVVEGTARAGYRRPARKVTPKVWQVLDTCHNPAGLQGEDRTIRARLGGGSRLISIPCRALLISTGDDGAERVAIFPNMIAPAPAGKHSVIPQTLHPTLVLWVYHTVSGLGKLQNTDPLDSGARDGEKGTLMQLEIMAKKCLR